MRCRIVKIFSWQMTQVMEAPPSSPSVTAISNGTEAAYNAGEEKAAMIQKVKQEVKRLMEEAVTRKFIHEDSSSVRSLCGVVDLCLTHKLKKSVSSPFSIGGLWNGGAITAGGKPEFSASLSLVSKLCKQLATTAELKQQLTDILCQVQDKQNAYKIMMKNYNAQNGQGSVSWAIQDFPSDRALKFHISY
ncbi:uncharacterized protein LOC142341702 isoform X2 [Convolutriloba macropyga]|uniref:uncharacterized protein LOC142341702 isoform X2 n=1 Tax=Convolutriloba macropyga TaxID=536237 RepID=UPI003F52549F